MRSMIFVPLSLLFMWIAGAVSRPREELREASTSKDRMSNFTSACSDGHPAPTLWVVGEPLGRPEVRACATMSTVFLYGTQGVLGVPTVFSEMPKVF